MAEVEQIISYPARKMSGGGQVWYYDFLKISQNPFGDNIDKTIVVEFDVTKKYKTKGAGSNPLLNCGK